MKYSPCCITHTYTKRQCDEVHLSSNNYDEFMLTCLIYSSLAGVEESFGRERKTGVRGAHSPS